MGERGSWVDRLGMRSYPFLLFGAGSTVLHALDDATLHAPKEATAAHHSFVAVIQILVATGAAVAYARLSAERRVMFALAVDFLAFGVGITTLGLARSGSNRWPEEPFRRV
jgi:hypothetical protein